MQVILWIGAKVYISDTRESTLEEAIKLGVPKENIVPIGTPVQEFIVKNGLSDSIDTVADFVGTKQTFNDAQNIGMSPCITLQ